jgi:3-oxoacyl-[acyl-carrier protein] reductase
MGRLQGKVAVVTGAGQGLGRSTAQRFATEGAKVVIADMNEETAHDTVGAITSAGGEAMAVVIDVSSAHDAERMVSATLA